MHAGPRWQFLAGLPQRLAAAVGAAELEAATRPADGVVRHLGSDRLWMGDRWLRSPIPRISLDLRPPVPAGDLRAAWGVEPWPVGRWDVRLHPAGAGEIRRIEVSAAPVPISLVDPADPAARALLDAMSVFYSSWRGGWEVALAATFVVVHAEDRPVAGAALVDDRHGIASVSCFCVDPDRLPGAAGSVLLDALEAVALDCACRRMCLDGSVFLHREHVPYLRHGYLVAPPYDGDANATVWAEKDLPAPS